MNTNFKYTLTKSLRKYTKYIPQLSKPVLRVLIQGRYSAHENQCWPNFGELETISCTCSVCALHWREELPARGTRSRPYQIIANELRNSREFLRIIRSNFANNAIVSAHAKRFSSWRWAAGMFEGAAFRWRLHRRHRESIEQLSRFADTKLLRSEEFTHAAQAI